MTTPAEDEAEFERRRRRSQKFLAFDLLAELHGQAEWQRFRREHPLLFLRAKLDLQAGPPGLWLSVDWHNYQLEVLFRFEWPAVGRVERRYCLLRFAEILADEKCAGGFLHESARWMARDVEIQSGGIDTRITVRGNREAWDWHEDHKNDPPQDAPRPLPRRQRVAGHFCGTCRARFRFEALPDRYSVVLPCGHNAAGEWTEDEPK